MNYLKRITIFLCALLMLGLLTTNANASTMLKYGSKGSRVFEVQKYLYQLNYLKTEPTGFYGKLTTEALRVFQIEHNLAVDGVAGPATIDTLREVASGGHRIAEYTVKPGDELEAIATQYGTNVAEIMARNNLSDKRIVVGQKLIVQSGKYHSANPNSRFRNGGIQAISWSTVNQLWKKEEVAKILDLETGKSFQAKRLYGYYHADVEPLTKEDTEIMKEIYGGKWSWDRRAVVVQLKNFYIAASINGMPHGGQSIYDNDFDGQFCVHFLGSRVHQTGRVDQAHHDMIERANRFILLSNQMERKVIPPVVKLE
ncbi:MAG: peptidoglycan-binding protein [Bacteroidota bacterium]